uniref:Uncharacterized protein n=1 Tax=Candidatus Kentrum sp. LFY TaxID=2126342 RepID=A0A450WQI4_9GAMM|nr:MAG: hypothetical protein BECKLFY1418C_GA0070996_105614 [Candidatus Kentron sp. LFY]
MIPGNDVYPLQLALACVGQWPQPKLLAGGLSIVRGNPGSASILLALSMPPGRRRSQQSIASPKHSRAHVNCRRGIAYRQSAHKTWISTASLQFLLCSTLSRRQKRTKVIKAPPSPYCSPFPRRPCSRPPRRIPVPCRTAGSSMVPSTRQSMDASLQGQVGRIEPRPKELETTMDFTGRQNL